MKYELKILTDDEKLKEICLLFWELGDFDSKYQFIRTVQDIADIKKISPKQVSQIALTNSEMWASCSSCEIPFIVRNRTEWNKLIEKEFFFEIDCLDCRTSKKNYEAIVGHHKSLDLELQRAFKAKRWESCNGDLIEILIIIADNYTTDEINKELFRPLIVEDLSFRSMRWKQINKLEELGLLWIEREDIFNQKSKIKKYHILNQLREILLKKYKDEFRNGERILNSNSAEITSDIITHKSGFIKGEFSLDKNISIKALKKYDIELKVDMSKKQFSMKIKEH